MTQGAQRSIARWIHIIFGIPILGYIYSPFKDLPEYAPVVRYVAFPAIALTGVWMWKGAAFQRRLTKQAATLPGITDNPNESQS